MASRPHAAPPAAPVFLHALLLLLLLLFLKHTMFYICLTPTPHPQAFIIWCGSKRKGYRRATNHIIQGGWGVNLKAPVL
jgi:hypothetical protein